MPDVLILEIERNLILNCDPSKTAELFEKFSQRPDLARRHRSAVVISFERAGLGGLSKTEEGREYVAKLVDMTPYVGYFLNGEIPTFHLRSFCIAGSYAISRPPTTKEFIQMSYYLRDKALNHCSALGDNPEPIEATFDANLYPELLQTDKTIQARAMREVFPMMLVAMSGSAKLKSRTIAESERIWGRLSTEFETLENYLRAFESHFKSVLEDN